MVHENDVFYVFNYKLIIAIPGRHLFAEILDDLLK